MDALQYSEWYDQPNIDPFKGKYGYAYATLEAMTPMELFDAAVGITYSTSDLAFIMLDAQGQIHVLHRIRHVYSIPFSLKPPNPQDGLNVAMLNDITDICSYFVEIPENAFHRTEILQDILTPDAINIATALDPNATQITPDPEACADDVSAIQSRLVMLIPPCVIGRVLAAKAHGLCPRDLWINIAAPMYNDATLGADCKPFIDWCRVAYAAGVGSANPLHLAVPEPLRLTADLYSARLNILRFDLPRRFYPTITGPGPNPLAVHWDTLPSEIWLLHIFPFVGEGNFRFVGGVSLVFRYIYAGLFPAKRTTYNEVYTVEQARLCYQDLKDHRVDEKEEDAGYKKPTQMETFCNVMARLGRQEVLEYLHSQNCSFYTATFTAAVEGGHFDLMKWLHQHNCPWDVGACAQAATQSDCTMLKWLHAQGRPWDVFTCDLAAYYGNLNVLKFARRKGCPWHEWTCSFAATKGHLTVLKWARLNGAPWDDKTTSGAALNGHLDILYWARSQGCPWDSSTCDCAAQNGHLEVLKWAFENGCDFLGFRVVSVSVENGQLEVLKWLYSIDSTSFGAHLATYAVEKGHFDTIKWLHSIGCIKFDYNILSMAASYGHLELVQWLRANGCPWNEYFFMCAAESENLELMRWSYENGCPLDEKTREYAGMHGIGPMAVERDVCCKIIFGGKSK